MNTTILKELGMKHNPSYSFANYEGPGKRFLSIKNLSIIRIFGVVAMLILNVNFSYGQLQERYWIFGRPSTTRDVHATIDFFPGGSIYGSSPTVPGPITPTLHFGGSYLPGGADFGVEGTAVVTDPVTGDLIFYTDGNTVLDETGTSILTGLGANISSAQPAAVCIQPVCPFDQYYIFSNQTGGTNFGSITYRTFNSQTSTFGSTTAMPGSYSTDDVGEGMIIIPSLYDPFVFWLICRLNDCGTSAPCSYVVYKIDQTGIGNGVAYQFGPHLDTDNKQVYGNMAYSIARGSDTYNVEFAYAIAGRVSTSTSNSSIITCQFNTQTGAFDNSSANTWVSWASAADATNPGSHFKIYDLEYSPSGDFLYFSTVYDTELYQLDFSTGTVRLVSYASTLGGGLKLGPDGYVYFIQNGGHPIFNNFGDLILARITTPDLIQTSGSFTYQTNIASYDSLQGFNMPEFTTVPTIGLQITGGGEMCPGEQRTLSTSFVTTGVNIVGYQWYTGTPGNGTPISGATNPSLVVTQPGTYFLVITSFGGCEIFSQAVTITEKDDCCEATSVQASVIYDGSTNNVINQNTSWDGKVYIADNIIVQVTNGAILDISNVDVAFGSCAGITFDGGSYLRANNSVFRPCDIDDVWYGLEFEHTSEYSSGALINECTFKNATVAIGVTADGEGQSYVLNIRLTNNLFANCHIGFYPKYCVVNKPVTGNTFMMDEHLPLFGDAGCSNLEDDYYHFGIYSIGASFNDIIGQNDFIYSGKEEVEFAGILANQAEKLNITDNRFTNNTAAIELTESQSFQIEQNEISVTSNAVSIRHQIFTSSCSNFHIANNQLYNLNTDVSSALYNSAIYDEYSSGFGISGNYVEGFDAAIQMEDNSSFNITDNRVKDAWLYGVYLNSPDDYYVTCNEINMIMEYSSNVTGIYVSSDEATSGPKSIRNNCILETHQAIYLIGQGSGIGDAIPDIKNNFLYNYVDFGVENINLSGDIGSGTSQTQAGKNTFSSNNILNGAMDIYTGTYALTAYGNTGISTISGGVTLTGSGAFTSTASCGLQLGGAGQGIADDEVCDRELPITSFVPKMGGKFKPNSIQEAIPIKEAIHESGRKITLTAEKLEVYPNPSNSDVAIEFYLGEQNCENCTLLMHDMNNKIIKALPLRQDAGTIHIDLSDVTPGIYMFRVSGNDQIRLTKKFVKL